MLEKEPVSFASLYGGAVVEALDYELGNAIRNIKEWLQERLPGALVFV